MFFQATLYIKSIVNVGGFGFIPNMHIQFGYYPIPPYSHVMVDAGKNLMVMVIGPGALRHLGHLEIII